MSRASRSLGDMTAWTGVGLKLTGVPGTDEYALEKVLVTECSLGKSESMQWERVKLQAASLPAEARMTEGEGSRPK